MLARLGADPEGGAVRGALDELLRRHLGEEEEELFPLLEPLLPTETGPLRVVVEEHRAIREMLDESTRGGLRVRALATLVESHFAKEEELILPFAVANLSPEALARFSGEVADGG